MASSLLRISLISLTLLLALTNSACADSKLVAPAFSIISQGKIAVSLPKQPTVFIQRNIEVLKITQSGKPSLFSKVRLSAKTRSKEINLPLGSSYKLRIAASPRGRLRKIIRGPLSQLISFSEPADVSPQPTAVPDGPSSTSTPTATPTPNDNVTEDPDDPGPSSSTPGEEIPEPPVNTPDSTPTPIPSATPPAGTQCSSVTYNFTAPTATITGSADITYHFATPVQCGQFVDGTWWVVGPVQITRITPDFYALVPSDAATYTAPMLQALKGYLNFRVNDPLCAHEPDAQNCISAADSKIISNFYISHFSIPSDKVDTPTYRNGFAIDPVADQNYYDSRFNTLLQPPALPKYNFKGELISGSPAPLLISPASDTVVSIVKAVSRNDINYGTGWGACDKKSLVVDAGSQSLNRGCLTSTAILTVVPTPPPADAFRPPYYGIGIPKLGLPIADDDYFRASQLRLWRLPNLPTSSVASTMPTQENVLKAFGGPWTFLFTHYGPGMSLQQPTSNIRSINGSTPLHYHSAIATTINAAMLRVMHADGDEAKRLAIVNQIVQRGLDYYFGLLAEMHYSSGTGFKMGHKEPILFAADLLNDPMLLAVAQDFNVYPTSEYAPNGRPGSMYFAEDTQTYFGADTYQGKPIALWGTINGATAAMSDSAVSAAVKGNEGNAPFTSLYPDLLPAPANGGFGGYPNYYNEPTTTIACTYGGNKTMADPRGERDGGYWTDLNTNQRPVVGTNGNGQPIYACPRTARVLDVLNGAAPAGVSTYLSCCSFQPMFGAYVVAKLMGHEELWNHPPFFSFVERSLSPAYSPNGQIWGGYGDYYVTDMYKKFLKDK